MHSSASNFLKCIRISLFCGANEKQIKSAWEDSLLTSMSTQHRCTLWNQICSYHEKHVWTNYHWVPVADTEIALTVLQEIKSRTNVQSNRSVRMSYLPASLWMCHKRFHNTWHLLKSTCQRHVTKYMILTSHKGLHKTTKAYYVIPVKNKSQSIRKRVTVKKLLIQIFRKAHSEKLWLMKCQTQVNKYMLENAWN